MAKSIGRSTAATTLTMKGDKNDPEKSEYRIFFPGGIISVCRTSDEDYWVHISVNHQLATNYYPDEPTGTIVDARLDDVDKHAVDTKESIRFNEMTNHMAVRIAVEKG